jgi:hypothetical protein
MAKQISPLVKLRGTIDDLCFYKSIDGFLAREKGGVSADRIRTDPKFTRTRLNGLEFGTGGKAAKAFRKAFSTEISKAADQRAFSRLIKQMVLVLQSDALSDFGYRQVQLGDVSKLLNFNLNNQVQMEQALTLPVEVAFNRTTGAGTITLPALTPTADVVMPEGNTHYSFFAAAAAIDFATGLAVTSRQETANLPWNSTAVTSSTLSLTLPAASTLPVFVVIGMEFVKMVNGKPYPASMGQSPLQVIAAYPAIAEEI